MLGFGSYCFAAGQGRVFAESGVSDEYAIEVTCCFEKVNGRQKVLDLRGRSSDLSLYVYNGSLQLYLFAAGGEFHAGDTPRPRVAGPRHEACERLLERRQGLRLSDAGEDAVLQERKAGYFVDDRATRSEESAGEVKRLRIWDCPSGT